MNASSLESLKSPYVSESLVPEIHFVKIKLTQKLCFGTSLVSMVTPNGDGDCKGIPPKKIKANSGLENLFGGIQSKPVKTQLNSTRSDHVIKN